MSYVHYQAIMTPAEFEEALFRVGAHHADLAAYFRLDRRTALRWHTIGPPNYVARTLQQWIAMGLSVVEAQKILDEATGNDKRVLPNKVRRVVKRDVRHAKRYRPARAAAKQIEAARA